MKVPSWVTSSNVIATAGLVVSLFAAFYSYNTGIVVQDRQSAIEEIKLFEDANLKILEASSAFIAAINKSQPLIEPREKMRVLMAQQAIFADGIKNKLKVTDRPYAEEYVEALQQLSRATNSVSKPTDMRPWAENFGRVMDTRNALSKAMSAKIGRT